MNNILIFIIDDDEFDANQIGLALTEDGFMNVRVFTNPDSMIKEISNLLRICIVDYRLDHRMNGFDVIESIKKVNPSCYFIMVSGMKNYSVIERFCNSVNRGRFITKDESDIKQKILRFVKEIIEDIKFMTEFYKQQDEVYKNIEHLKNIVKNHANY